MFSRKVKIVEKPVVTIGSNVVAYSSMRYSLINNQITKQLQETIDDDVSPKPDKSYLTTMDMNTVADVNELRSKVAIQPVINVEKDTSVTEIKE